MYIDVNNGEIGVDISPGSEGGIASSCHSSEVSTHKCNMIQVCKGIGH